MRFSAHTIVSYSYKIFRPYSEYARSDGKSVNRFLTVLDLLSGRNSLMLTKRSAAFGDENDKLVACKSQRKSNDSIFWKKEKPISKTYLLLFILPWQQYIRYKKNEVYVVNLLVAIFDQKESRLTFLEER